MHGCRARSARDRGIRENRRRFEAFCYSLTEEQLMRPVPNSTWVVRDFAAHLDTLDTALLRWFRGVAAGGSVDAGVDGDGARFDVDAFNDAQVAERRAWPLERIFAEAEANRALLIESMLPLTDAQIDQPMTSRWRREARPGDLPLKLFLIVAGRSTTRSTSRYDQGAAGAGGRPEIKRWLDNPYVTGHQALMAGPPGIARGAGAWSEDGTSVARGRYI
jgi:hypothetical protein